MINSLVLRQRNDTIPSTFISQISFSISLSKLKLMILNCDWLSIIYIWIWTPLENSLQFLYFATPITSHNQFKGGNMQIERNLLILIILFTAFLAFSTFKLKRRDFFSPNKTFEVFLVLHEKCCTVLLYSIYNETRKYAKSQLILSN